MISAIVAVDENWGIGYNGNLLEHIPEDLKNFKEITTGNTVVMGRKTWDSLPKKPLPNRTNIVITSNPHISSEANFWTLETTRLFMQQQPNLEFFVIGGGQIYEKLLQYCDKVYITKIFKQYKNVDTYFPNLDDLINNWKLINKSDIKTYNDIDYQFQVYEKI